MKKTLLLATILITGLILAIPISAADTGTVTATVTPKLISLTVSPTSVGYGIVTLDNANAYPSGDPWITVTNNGNVPENFFIKGSNATVSGGSPWVLAATRGTDQYVHKFGPGPSDPPTSWTALTTTLASLKGGVGAAGISTFKLRMEIPTSSSSYAEHATTVTVQATE